MSRDFLQKAASIFENQENPEKWDAFLELISFKEQIKFFWRDKLLNRLNEYYSKDWKHEDWTFKIYNGAMVWHLKNFDHNSVSIWFEHLYRLSIWVDGSVYDLIKINELLKTSKFSPLLEVFGDNSRKLDGNYLVSEFGNFIFQSIFDKNFTEAQNDLLAWYAGNKTEEFADQIKEKVNIIIGNIHLTNLIRELV